MQDYAHTARHGGAYDPDLSIRLDAFGHSIEQALRDGCNEVLVVGHSSGAHLGVSVLARLQRAGIVTPQIPYIVPQPWACCFHGVVSTCGDRTALRPETTGKQ